MLTGVRLNFKTFSATTEYQLEMAIDTNTSWKTTLIISTSPQVWGKTLLYLLSLFFYNTNWLKPLYCRLFMHLSVYVFVSFSQCDEASQILLAQQHRIRRSDSILSSSFVCPLSGRKELHFISTFNLIIKKISNWIFLFSIK